MNNPTPQKLVELYENLTDEELELHVEAANKAHMNKTVKALQKLISGWGLGHMSKPTYHEGQPMPTPTPTLGGSASGGMAPAPSKDVAVDDHVLDKASGKGYSRNWKFYEERVEKKPDRCECGASKALGAGKGGTGHSAWCPWSKP